MPAFPLLLLLLLGAAGLPAQEILWQRVGKLGQEHLTGPIVAIGDRNGDGYDDFMASAFLSTPTPVRNIVVVSGKDGTFLKRIPELQWGPYGKLFAAGDMDGDGMLDYAFQHYYQARSSYFYSVIEFRSGKDDRTLWKIEGRFDRSWGRWALGDLDLDGDGKPDLLVSVPGDIPNPSVYAYSNAGSLLYKLERLAFLGKLGDVDGDGGDDFMVNGLGMDTRGKIDVLSGKTGKRIRTVYGERGGDWIGERMWGVGDVDADGFPDFVASGLGLVQTVFSGKTGKILHSFRGFYVPWLAHGDFDLDGAPDILVGNARTTPNTGGSVYWYSLRDFSLTYHLLPTGLPKTRTGIEADFAVGFARRGHPFPVLLTTEVYYGNNTYPFYARGRLTLYRMAPKGVEGFGDACTGTLAQSPRIGLRNLGDKGVRLHLSRAPAGAPAVLLLGFSRTRWGNLKLPRRVGRFGLPRCFLHTSLDLVVSVVAGRSGAGRGYASVDIPLPLAGPFPKLTVYGQWLVWDAAGRRPGALTAALTWRH